VEQECYGLQPNVTQGSFEQMLYKLDQSGARKLILNLFEALGGIENIPKRHNLWELQEFLKDQNPYIQAFLGVNFNL